MGQIGDRQRISGNGGRKVLSVPDLQFTRRLRVAGNGGRKVLSVPDLQFTRIVI